MDSRDREIALELLKLAALGLFFVLIFGIVGCAAVPLTHDQCNATKYATAHEHEQCLLAATKYEEEQHEKEDRAIRRREATVKFVRSCMASEGVTLVTYKLTRWQKQVLDREGININVTTLPRGLGRANFGCMTDEDLQRAIDQIARGGW